MVCSSYRDSTVLEIFFCQQTIFFHFCHTVTLTMLLLSGIANLFLQGILNILNDIGQEKLIATVIKS